MSEPYLIGIDLGTGSCKALVATLEGQPLGFGSASYPATNAQARWVEQDPSALLDGLTEAVRTALEKADLSSRDGCLGMSIGGALHSFMALDPRDEPLTGVMTWADTRAACWAEHLSQVGVGEVLYERTGCPAHAMYPLAKIAWLREERPNVFGKARWFISAKEYVTLRLTGRRVVDYSIAGGTGLLNTRECEWDQLALDTAGVHVSQLFTLCRPEHVLGPLRPEFAKAMGLPSSPPIILGSSDAVNSSLGAGAVKSEQYTCMVGTSGALRLIAPKPILDPKARSWCYAIDPEHWLVGGAINNGGLALQWLRDTLRGVKNTVSFEDLTRWASEVEPGAGGLLCLPLLAGERSPYWDSTVRGTMLGLSLSHDHCHCARAFIEGVCFAMRNLREILDEIGGACSEVRASGGFARSDLWLQTMTDVLDRPLLVPSSEETSSVGAWFWALRGAGRVDHLEQAAPFVEAHELYEPRREIADRYAELYCIYKQVYPALRDAFTGLAEYRRTH